MRILVERKTFVKALAIGSSFVPKKPVIPILECVKIKISDNIMHIISSDNDNVISRGMEIMESDLKEPYVMCVRASALLSYVKLLSGDTVELLTDDKNLVVRHGKGETTIPLEDADVYPKMRSDGSVFEMDADADNLNRFITDGNTFVGDDALRPVMSCMYVYRDDKGTGYCCSDGRVLITDRNREDKGDQYMDFMIGKNIFRPLSELLNDCSVVNIRKSDRNVLYRGGNTSIMARSIEGKYPNFWSVIPNDNVIKVKLNKEELTGAIQRCNLASSHTSFLVFDFDNKKLHIEAQDIDFGIKSSEVMDCIEYDGDNIKIGINGNKMLNCLSSINTDEVVMTMKDPTRPVLVHEDGNDTKIVLIMPMMI